MNRITTLAFGFCFTLALFAAAHSQNGSNPTGGGGGGTPGGSNLDVQCNISGAFGACDTGKFTYSAANHSMGLPSGAQTTNPQIAFTGSTSTGITSQDNGGFPEIDYIIGTTLRFQVSYNTATASVIGFPFGALTFYTNSNTTPTATGSCAVNTQLGGPTMGSFVANGACVAGTVILALPSTGVNNGWACDAHDLTTPADLMNQTASSTSSVTLTGSMVSGDKVVFKCLGF